MPLGVLRITTGLVLTTFTTNFLKLVGELEVDEEVDPADVLGEVEQGSDVLALEIGSS